jgi:outer membrane biosynthesis protein TonB
MRIIRRTVLSQVVLAGAAVFLAASLSFASQGELTASDRDALINIRTSANTEAEIIETRPVGDRVEVVAMTKSNEGLIWYKVKVPQTGTVGWVRGDLVKVFGSKKPPQAATKPASTGKPTSVPLPKPSAKPKPAAAKPAPAPSPKPSPAASPSPKPSSSPSPTASASPSPAASPAPSPSGSPSPAPPSPDGGGTPAQPEPEVATSTIVSFQTQSYAVRVFSRSGQLRLNLFNRRTNTVALKEVPVQSKAQEDGTVYTYGKELEVTVFVPNSGATKLTTNALGTTVEEFAEPTAASTGTPAPQ